MSEKTLRYKIKIQFLVIAIDACAVSRRTEKYLNGKERDSLWSSCGAKR